MTSNLALKPCMTRQRTLHGIRATSRTFETSNLAPFFVQHRSNLLALQPCKVSCTPVGATKDNTPTYVGKDNPIPVMHCVQDGRFPLPNLTANHLDQTSHRGNQLTARAEIGATPCQR